MLQARYIKRAKQAFFSEELLLLSNLHCFRDDDFITHSSTHHTTPDLCTGSTRASARAANCASATGQPPPRIIDAVEQRVFGRQIR